MGDELGAVPQREAAAVHARSPPEDRFALGQEVRGPHREAEVSEEVMAYGYGYGKMSGNKSGAKYKSDKRNKSKRKSKRK